MVSERFLEGLQDKEYPRISLFREAKDLSVTQLIRDLGIKDVNEELFDFNGGSNFSFKDFLDHGFTAREALENVWVNNEFNRRAI